MSLKRKNNLKEISTIKDIAKYTGLSDATVSYVLNNKNSHYSKATYKLVMDAIDILNYKMDTVARGLRIRKTYNLAFLIPFISDFFYEVFLGIQDAAVEHNHSVSLFSSQNKSIQESINIDNIISNKYDGVIISSEIFNENNYLKLINRNVPVVTIEKFIDKSNVFCVTINNKEISKKAINYLVSLGHKRIGIVCETLKIKAIKERVEGYKEALKENDIGLTDSLIFINEGLGENYSNGYEYFKSIIKENKKVTAFFVTSDVVAVGAMSAIIDSGLKVPDDISIIGFDGLEIGKFLNPKLTSISQPRYKMGYEATNSLFEIMEGKTIGNIILDAELVIRGSTSMVKSSI